MQKSEDMNILWKLLFPLKSIDSTVNNFIVPCAFSIVALCAILREGVRQKAKADLDVSPGEVEVFQTGPSCHSLSIFSLKLVCKTVFLSAANNTSLQPSAPRGHVEHAEPTVSREASKSQKNI